MTATSKSSTRRPTAERQPQALPDKRLDTRSDKGLSAATAAAAASANTGRPVTGNDTIDRVGPLRLPYELIDTLAYARRARLTGGMAPTAAALAWFDWAMHLAFAPGKQLGLGVEAARLQARFLRYAARVARHPDCPNCIEPLEQDRRFADPAWQRWPFNVIHQGFLLQQHWWHQATTGVRGVSKHHEDMVEFAARQWLDMFSPANVIATNPEVLQATLASGGVNLWQGAVNFIDDVQRTLTGAGPAGAGRFEVGRDVAVTPGKVVYRNRLIELIQYTPTTAQVHAEPVLIVPSWVMKYYILDLSPHNSMVRWLVQQGHTVFIVSWKNPDPEDGELGLEDYRRLGVMDALDAVGVIVPERKVQAVGYCLGGTLLAIAAAAMARDGDERLCSLSLLATETDFRETGEIKVFVDESQLAWLDAGMKSRGYLEGWQMAGSFQLLNARDLIWSRRVREYLLGQRQEMIDLMAWNADTTRMPWRMHGEYLRHLYMDNDLSEGRWRVGGRPVALADIRLPMFVVGTVRDHVAPWRSVHKIHLLNDSAITFVLTSGGHNAGVVSEPGHPRRSYQIATRAAGGRYVDPDQWRADAPRHDGSWWPAWDDWLAQRASGRIAPPTMGGAIGGAMGGVKGKATGSGATPAVLDDAPGHYVRQK